MRLPAVGLTTTSCTICTRPVASATGPSRTTTPATRCLDNTRGVARPSKQTSKGEGGVIQAPRGTDPIPTPLKHLLAVPAPPPLALAGSKGIPRFQEAAVMTQTAPQEQYTTTAGPPAHQPAASVRAPVPLTGSTAAAAPAGRQGAPPTHPATPAAQGPRWALPLPAAKRQGPHPLAAAARGCRQLLGGPPGGWRGLQRRRGRQWLAGQMPSPLLRAPRVYPSPARLQLRL